MENDLLVVQSNKLIEAHYKQQYTVQEQRMVLWVVSEIHKEDYFNKKYEHKTITISAQKYAELMDITADDVYKRAQDIGDNLMQKVITIKTDKGEDKGWEMFHWIESMKYREGIIEVLIAPVIIPYIIDLKEKFTAFRLENILYLRSSHAIKLYQILAQYKQIGERKITVDELRSTLGVSNVKIYQTYGDIKRKILEISKREINEKTDLIISYSAIKQSRKVVAIQFKITQKPNQEIQAKKEFEQYVLQLPDGDSLKTLFQNYAFDQISVKTEFQKFLAERIINYDPLSSKPLRMKKMI